ncbi:MAG: hypothetical protein K2X86_02975, partial [Cytophagaceae bacterium]|nr:hypothetical protein [Cytophagaceae bacterium]
MKKYFYPYLILNFLLCIINPVSAVVYTVPVGSTYNAPGAIPLTIAAGDVLNVLGILNVTGNFTNNGSVYNYNIINFTSGNFNNNGFFQNDKSFTLTGNFDNRGTIQNNDNMRIGGNFTNGVASGVPASFFTNSDSIWVSGNWRENNLNPALLGGTVILNSPVATQVILPGGGSAKFTNIWVTGSRKNLQGTLAVSNNLNLQAIIDPLSPGDSLKLEGNSNVINYSSTGFIDGPLYRTARPGTGNDVTPMIFPVGDAAGFRPVVLTNMPFAGTNNWTLKIETATTPSPSYTGPPLPPGTTFENKRYWKYDIVGSSGPAFNATTTLFYDPTQDLIGPPYPGPSTIVAMQKLGGANPNGTYTNLGSNGYTATAVTGNIKATVNPGQSTYLALASVLCAGVDGILNVSPRNDVCAGTLVTFSVSTTSPYQTVQYFRNGTLVMSGPQGTIYSTSTLANGDFISAVISNAGCSRPTNIIGMTVSPPIMVNLGPDQTLCPGKSIMLDAGFYGNGVTYYWNTNQTTQTITVSSPGTYYATAYRTPGCYGSDTINILNGFGLFFPPNLTTGTVTSSSIQFNWSNVPGAMNYQFSTDSINWINDTDFTQTISGLSPGSMQCAWVRAMNTCDTMASQRVCGTTFSNCIITYTKPKDTAVCAGTYNITFTLNNINPPSYKIAWDGGPFTRNTSYNVIGSMDRIVRFSIMDTASFVGCIKNDSIKINQTTSNNNWSGLNPSYCTSSFTSILTPVEPGGIFTGPGV